MSAPVISGDALNGSRIDKIRERVANSTRDDLYAPAYGDRRYLLGLVDEMAEVLHRYSHIGELQTYESRERFRVAAGAALAKLSPTSPSADHPDSSLCGESSAGTGGHSLDELKSRAADLGIDLQVTHEFPAIVSRQFDYAAVDGNTYDGAPDSSNRHHIGRGPTPESAVRALFEILGVDEADIDQGIHTGEIG
jgi:hypothetical protein